MISKFRILLFLVATLICVPMLAYSGGNLSGQPFQYLQQQIETLQQQVSELNQQIALIKQDGVYGYKVKREYKEVSVPPGEYIDIQFSVPPGTNILGGGTRPLYPSERLTLVNSFIIPMVCTTSDYETSWDWYYALYRNDTSRTLSGTLEAWAIYGGEEFKDWYGCD
jgi:hypothetical protein